MAGQSGNLTDSVTRTIEVPPDISTSNFSERMNTVIQNPRPVWHSLPAYLIDQVGRQISRSLLRGDRVIRLQLRPSELGAVKVEMDIKGNILKLGMIAENSSVKQLLLSNVHELRDALVEQGVKIEKLDVQINQNFNHSLADSKEELKEGQRGIRGQSGGPLTTEDDTDESISALQDRTTGDRLLNLVA